LVRRYLEATARDHDFTLVRCDHFLTPNEARNLALRFVDSEFVAFIDYETIVVRGWLRALERCARETGAWVVGPTYLDGRQAGEIVHMAGGAAHIEEPRRWFREQQHHGGIPLADLGRLAREPTEHVDFHCVLVRRDVFENLGPLDEGLMSLCDHSDLCMAVRRAGGEVWLEPSIAIAYRPPRHVGGADRWYWIVRWSDAANRASLDRFREKWKLADDDPFVDKQLSWSRSYRRYAYRPYMSVVSRCFGRRRRAVYDVVDALMERAVLARDRRRRVRNPSLRIVHAASWNASLRDRV
jgi:GT2 family glycosyltransferase